jgi:hypothetical protein
MARIAPAIVVAELARELNWDKAKMAAAYNAGGAVYKYGGIPPSQDTRDSSTAWLEVDEMRGSKQPKKAREQRRR